MKLSGRKDEPVALVFAAMRMPEQCQPIPKEAAKAGAKCSKYQDLLKIEGEDIPDPMALGTGWESEENSIKRWPPTMAFDIGQYFLNIDNIPLKTRLMSDYKEGKAYSYFASGWLSGIEYNPINDDSKYCILRATCLPSQNINNLPWKVWVCVGKLLGKIHTAFCTCFAG